MSINSLFEKQAAPIAGKQVLSDSLKHYANLKDTPGVREEDLLDLNDYAARRRLVFDKTLQAVQNLKPVSNEKHTLRITDVKYEKPKDFTKAEYKQAILEGRTLAHKITGRYELVDNATGQVINKTGKKTLLNVPYLTEFGTFVRNGIDVAVNNQMRLRPGVYTHLTADGYPEAQFNVKPGTGLAFRTWLDPETSVFYMTQQGRKVPLYPVMKAMGMSDERMRATWGEDVFKANKALDGSSHAQRWLNEKQEMFDKRNKPVVDEDLKEEPLDFGKKDESSIESNLDEDII